MTTQTAREFLVAQGLAKPGRGKFSGEAHKALDKAVSEGIKFADWPKEVVTETFKVGRRTHTRTRKVNPVNVAKEPDKIHQLGSRVFIRVNGKKVYSKAVDGGMRECCNRCRVSLFYCICIPTGGKPIANFDNAHLSVPVEIESA